MSLKLVEHMIHFMYTIFSKHVIAIQKVYPADFAVHAKLSYHADHADHADCADYTDQWSWGSECDVPVPGIPGTKNFNLVGVGTGIETNWYQKKVSEPVSEKFGLGGKV